LDIKLREVNDDTSNEVGRKLWVLDLMEEITGFIRLDYFGNMLREVSSANHDRRPANHLPMFDDGSAGSDGFKAALT
jgi:hypothetical protein